jgi:anti-sigma B factor antagonist
LLESSTARRSPSPARRAVVYAEGANPLPELGSDRDPIVGLAERGDALVLSLAGELDLYSAPALREALGSVVERSPKRLVVDLAQVTFVDSTILGALVEARSQLGGNDAFALAAPGFEVRRALEVSGLDRHFAVHERIETAIGST